MTPVRVPEQHFWVCDALQQKASAFFMITPLPARLCAKITDIQRTLTMKQTIESRSKLCFPETRAKCASPNSALLDWLSPDLLV